MLYGPPGTGKTLLARAVAHHTDCTFIRVSGSELVQKYIGEGSRMVRELFVMARYFTLEHFTILLSTTHSCVYIYVMNFIPYFTHRCSNELLFFSESMHHPLFSWMRLIVLGLHEWSLGLAMETVKCSELC